MTGLCNREKIAYKIISHRVKEFESFYNKIIERTNKPGNDKEKLPIEIIRNPRLEFERVTKIKEQE